jgi:heme A synthase
LMADAIVPLVALVIGGWFVMLTQNLPPDTVFTGLSLVVIVAMVQMLCGAYGVTKGERALQTRLIAIVVSYCVIALGFSVASFTGALIAAVFVVLTLMGLVSDA